MADNRWLSFVTPSRDLRPSGTLPKSLNFSPEDEGDLSSSKTAFRHQPTSPVLVLRPVTGPVYFRSPINLSPSAGFRPENAKAKSFLSNILHVTHLLPIFCAKLVADLPKNQYFAKREGEGVHRIPSPALTSPSMQALLTDKPPFPYIVPSIRSHPSCDL